MTNTRLRDALIAAAVCLVAAAFFIVTEQASVGLFFLLIGAVGVPIKYWMGK